MQRIDSCPKEDLIYMSQGFRHKKNKDMYRKMMETMKARKEEFFPQS
jgi:hypothetical protein